MLRPEQAPVPKKDQPNLDFRSDQEIRESIFAKRRKGGDIVYTLEEQRLIAEDSDSGDVFRGPGWGRKS